MPYCSPSPASSLPAHRLLKPDANALLIYFDVTFRLSRTLLKFSFLGLVADFCDPSAEVPCVGAGRGAAETKSPAGGQQGPISSKGFWGAAWGFRIPGGPDPGGRVTLINKKFHLKLQRRQVMSVN